MLNIFENIIAGKLLTLLKNVLIMEQHLFVAGRSSLTNLIIYHNVINSALEEDFQVNAIYTDF